MTQTPDPRAGTPTGGASDAPGGSDPRDGMPVADRVVDALRTYAAVNVDVTRHVARWLGVGTAAAEAFGQVVYAEDRSAPLTPTVLGRRVGLSTGATTALINRLEAAGLVTRSREHRDRRVVTLRVPPDVKEQAVRFFAPLGDRVDALMRQHPEEVLLQMVAVLDDLSAAVAEVVEGFEASQDPPVTPGAPREG